MTRREEIVTATLGCRQNYVDLKRPITSDDVADAFEKGAYWADKTMLEKTISWFYKNAHKWKYWDKNGCLLITVIMDDYRQAMEE